jgi:non-ribosomal peptide synthetase component F
MPSSSSTLVSSSDSGILYGQSQPDLIRKEILADILEASASLYPDKTALIFENRSLTYGELNLAADRVASFLIASGVGPGQIVGLWLPRGIDLLVMQAGIAKTGAAWLPFDADTPVDRIAVCLADANAIGILSCAEFEAQLHSLRHQVWIAETAAAHQPETWLRRRASESDYPAYVIYTSGSTGKPKGILVSQASICHFLRSENQVLGINRLIASIRDFQWPSICHSKKSGSVTWLVQPYG